MATPQLLLQQSIRRNGMLEAGQARQLLKLWAKCPQVLWGQPIARFGAGRKCLLFASYAGEAPALRPFVYGHRVVTPLGGGQRVVGVMIGERAQIFHLRGLWLREKLHRVTLATGIARSDITGPKVGLTWSQSSGCEPLKVAEPDHNHWLRRLLAERYGKLALQSATPAQLVQMYFTQALPPLLIAAVGVVRRDN